MPHVTIRISEDLKEDFKDATFLNKTDMTELLLTFIRNYVKQHKEKLEEFKKIK